MMEYTILRGTTPLAEVSAEFASAVFMAMVAQDCAPGEFLSLRWNGV